MPDISVINYQKKFTIPKARILKAVDICMKALRMPHASLYVVFVGEKRMRALNKKFLGHDFVTDVITFDHGDIVICPAQAKRFAKEHNQSIDCEMVLYVVHGLLHLSGYKDKTPSDIECMRAMEQKMLAKL